MSRRPVLSPGSAAGEVFRLTAPVVLWWVWLAFAALNFADFGVQGASARFATVVSAILVTITGLTYALALRPRVVAESSDLVIVNPFREHRVPWRAIRAVDNGEWVQVHYELAAAPGSGAAVKTVYCWGLYVSARSRRKAASGTPKPRVAALMSRAGILQEDRKEFTASPRMPEEARYLTSLPPAIAIASRLDTRARKERAGGSATAARARVRWSWPSIAAVLVPAVALLVILLA